MSFPIPSNTTCDVYKSGNAPPAAPDTAGLAVRLTLRAVNLKQDIPYSHWADMPLATDIVGGDSVYVPDKNGTQFKAQAFERIRSGGGGDYRRVYLMRQAVTWPSDNL
jgi:hypothetical protein